MCPGATCLLGDMWTLDEKYPGMVPCALSAIWMLSPLLHWLGKLTPSTPRIHFFLYNGAHMAPQEVEIVSGPHLPLCQLWCPQDRLHVSDLPEECALALEPHLAGIFVQVIFVLVTKLVPYSLPLGPILIVL